MDLLESNALHQPLWRKSYTASEVYGLLDLSSSSMEALLASFLSTSVNGWDGLADEQERLFFMSGVPESYEPKCD